MAPLSDGETQDDALDDDGSEYFGIGNTYSGNSSYQLGGVKDWSSGHLSSTIAPPGQWTFPDEETFPQTDSSSLPAPISQLTEGPVNTTDSDAGMASQQPLEQHNATRSGHWTRAAAHRGSGGGLNPPPPPSVPAKAEVLQSDTKAGTKRKRNRKPKAAPDATPSSVSVKPTPATASVSSAGPRSGKVAHQPASSSQVASAIPSTSLDPVIKRGGRQLGVTNFTFADVAELLRLVRAYLPIGPDGWERVAAEYNAYAARCNRLRRDVTSLRTKYYKLVNSRKPTGNPTCPPHVQEAKNIERDIQAAVFMGTVKDDPAPSDWDKVRNTAPESDLEVDSASGFEDEDGADAASQDGQGIGDEDDGAEPPPAKRTRATVAPPPVPKAQSLSRSAVRQRHRERSGDLLAALGEHLNPEARAKREVAREEQRTQRMGALVDVLNQQAIRAENHELRQQVDRLTHELFDARMVNVRLENELRMLQMMTGFYASPASNIGPQQWYSDESGSAPEASGYADDVSGRYVVPQSL